MIRIKRVYDKPSRDDGKRILDDRPRPKFPRKFPRTLIFHAVYTTMRNLGRRREGKSDEARLRMVRDRDGNGRGKHAPR